MACVASVLIHAVALFVLAAILLQAIEFGGATESAIPDTTITAQTERPPEPARRWPRSGLERCAGARCRP